MPKIKLQFHFNVIMRLSSKLKHAQFSGAEMRILQASKNQLVKIISVMVLIVVIAKVFSGV